MSAADKAPMDPETRRTRQRQVLLFSGVAAAGLLVFAVWISSGGGGGSPPPSGIEAELAGPDTAEASWVRRSEARIGELETQIRDMETRRRRFEQENAQLRERLALDAEDGRAVIDRQAAVMDELRRRLEARAAPPVPASGAGPDAGDAAAPAGAMIQEFESGGGPASGDGAAGSRPRPLESWLPAGSYADAVVLAGVDASAGVSSQGDPRPVLLRLTGPARSAAEGGEALEVDVAGCTLTGAAYGDLS